MYFIDEVKIYIKAGDGGDGGVSFRREKFIEFGGPDGGHGGAGGSVILVAVAGLNTLVDFRYQQHFKAKRGENGMGRNRSGESGEDLVLQVPIGTQILSEDKSSVIADLDEEGQYYCIAKGGRGGAGNAAFKSSVNQAPKTGKKGQEGDEIWVWLQLKLISDAGLVGLPNAGKSTFLSKVTAAKPKIADYPFTTLIPQLGVVYIADDEFVIADIPGLIEGASAGHGLGDKFLKHIERCKILVHLIDASGDVEEAYKVIRHELSSYSKLLSEKEEIVVLNKTDLMTAEELYDKQQEVLDLNPEAMVLSCSCATTQGLEQVLLEILKVLRQKAD